MYTVHAHTYLGVSHFNQNPLVRAFYQINKSENSQSRRTNSYWKERALQPLRKISYFNKGLSHLTSRGFKQGLKRVRVLSPDDPKVRAPEDEEEEEEEEEEIREKREAERKAAVKEDWVMRGWAPWEHVLTPEADFAIKAVEDTQNDDMRGLRTPEALEAFERVTPKLRNKDNYDFERNMVLPQPKTIKIGDEEYEVVPRTSQWGEPDVNETVWNSPLVFTLIPPRDWPPLGWQVDAEELAFIREAHKLESVRVDPLALENPSDTSEASFPRFEMFMKQYNHWVAANKLRLDEEASQVDNDYHPGRRRTGSNYVEGMYELPFVYPGQIYGGHVTCVHLYEGAFVFIGCVHDGWVPIKGNDWYWVRHHIKVGMHVQVEVVAKRDPFWFRFPIELRFVNPNIDHLIFNKFEFPPIFARNDANLEELCRETGRPYIPRRRSAIKPEDQPLSEIHPYSKKIGQIHVLEQAILDEEEEYPNEKAVEDEYVDESEEEYPNEKMAEDEYVDELDTDTKFYDSDNDGYWIHGQYEDLQLPKLILTTDEKDLDVDAARAERKIMNKLQEESETQGQTFVRLRLQREKQMDEFDIMHKHRSIEEREALIRDISCRLELGLPIEEPGRYADDDLWSDVYTTWNHKYRSDYWGDPKNIEKDFQEVKKTTVPVGSTLINDSDNSTRSSSTDVQNVGNNSASKNIGMPREENTRNDKTSKFAKGKTIPTSTSRPLVNNQDNSNDSEGGGEAAESDMEDN